MIVMLTNSYSFQTGRIAGAFPGLVGHLHTPDSWRTPVPAIPESGLGAVPFGFDNGVYGAWNSKRAWNESLWLKGLEKIAPYSPLWALVPDWVGDRDETLRRWDLYAPAVQEFGVPLAFAVQDGMSESDVPKECDVVFVGGTTTWKWAHLNLWTSAFERVHVGRVNTYRLLWMAHNAGVESCDGTGWFRGDQKQLGGLLRYLRESINGRDQGCLL